MIGNVSKIFCFSFSNCIFVGLFEKNMKSYFLCLDFRVLSVFLFSVVVRVSSLLKIKIIFALVLYVKSSVFGICSRLFITNKSVSVEFVIDLLWFGKEGWSIIWICASSKLKVPSCGEAVVKGKEDVFASCCVRVWKIVDLPVFGNPARTHCMSAFFIPI